MRRLLDSEAAEKLYLREVLRLRDPMARKKAARRDWRLTLFLAISLVIVLSMVLTMFLVSAPTK
jgi:hypothetical protein